MCMLMVGKVKQQRGPEVTVDVDGKVRKCESGVPVSAGDFVIISGKRITKRLEMTK